ncbi:electron transfer flavoprotein beta subunit [Alkalibaculum bacchi]|uniref:Electron transfer flavoprotein small subunit n=1 Tax=Alkalibaculum bacchi TaxID=645887 RepID=A0A366I105_9FIRM|nr:electron transfer flavoprotein subunit beta/FixA family protein [Alkalibaculum bacchi]RBP61063.1 electron transfer flavoprotein beta subunit [Alkalibaculum bacchi]
MDIIVCMKLVPNTAHMTFNPKTMRLERYGILSLINPADIDALECALNMKKDYGGTVTILTMGIAGASECVEKGIAAGADEGYLITDPAFAGSDTYATGMVLSAAVRWLQQKNQKRYDLILCGSVTVDGETGQTGSQLAEQLDWAQISCASDLRQIGDKLWAKQETEEETLWLESDQPTLVTIEPKYGKGLRPVDMEKLRQLEKEGVPKLTLQELEPWLDRSAIGAHGSPTKIARSYIPFTDRKQIVISSGSDSEKAQALLGLLKQENCEVTYE